MKSRPALFCMIGLFLLLAGCARTSITDVWLNREYGGPPFASMMILAQTGEGYSRASWETIIAERYRDEGLNAVAAVRDFPEGSGAPIHLVIAHARENDMDGVLVVRHEATRTAQSYHPPRTEYYYSPFYPHYPGRYFRGYYGPYRYHRYHDRYDPFWPPYYGMVVTPGYTTVHQVVQVASYLYSASTGEQVWSMSTQTVDPRSADHLAAEISRTTLRSLRKYCLLRPAR